MKILTAAEMREVDRLTTAKHHIPSLVLMENAGKSVAQFIQGRFSDLERRPVIVLCGKGNNGGDGFVVARHLLKAGANVEAFLVSETRNVKGGASTNLKRWRNASGHLHIAGRGAPIEFPEDAIIVDALLGTGARGPVEGPLAEVIAAVNRRGPRCFVVAVDIPSGLHADTGEVQGAAVVADCTVTFTAPKPGLVFGAGQRYVGQLAVSGIGSPPVLIEETGKGNLRWSEPDEFKAFAI